MKSLIEIFYKIKSYIQQYIFHLLFIYGSLGSIFIIIYMCTPEKYTSDFKILPEIENNTPQSLTNLVNIAQSFGFSNYQSSSIQKIIPTVTNSRFVMERIINHSYNVNDSSSLNLFQYFELPKSGKSYQQLSYILKTKIIDISEDMNTSIITMKVTTKNPRLSAQIGNSLINYINLFFSTRYKTKSSLKREILLTRRKEILKKLDTAKINFIDFVQKNQTRASSALDYRYDFLKNEVDRLTKLYDEISIQTELNDIEALGQTPVLNILDRPSLPVSPSNKKIIYYLFIYVILSSLCFITLIYYQEFLKANKSGE